MVKLHTRIKRKLDLTSSSGGIWLNTPKQKGARTFSTKEAAESYAKEQKIAKFTVVPAKKGKRFKIVE